MTFGTVIRERRHAMHLQACNVAEMVGISAQYLCDIEMDRRLPPPPDRLRQIATVLELNEDYLCFLAGRLPDDLPRNASEAQVLVAVAAMREILKGESQ